MILASCATLQSIFALSRVDFSLDGVSGVQVAGIEFDRVGGYEDLSASDLLRVGTVMAQGNLPVSVTLELTGRNPGGNPDARLLALDWVLFLQERETVSGVLEEEIRLPAGEATPVPVPLSLDLMEFFEGSGRDLVDLVLGLMGVGGAQVELRLEARPSISTPLGPMRYPEPLVLRR